jgi:coenzyme PQQ precursor peptide PqqA
MTGETHMAWTKPTAKEVTCGMEINMYAPAEDDTGRGGDGI